MAVDVTVLAIAVTAGLAVGIVALLVVIAFYVNSRRRVQRLQDQLTGRVQRRTTSVKSTSHKVRVTDSDIMEIIRSRRPISTGQMTGYPGRMYIPDGLPATDSNEMKEVVGDQSETLPDNYEHHITPASRRRRYVLEESSVEDSSSDSDSDHDRRCRHIPRVAIPPVVLMPSLPTTTALVHPALPPVQPQQPRAAVFTASRYQGSDQREDQQREAVAMVAMNRTPATTACQSPECVTSFNQANASSSSTTPAASGGRLMTTTAVAMVGRQRGSSTQQQQQQQQPPHHFNDDDTAAMEFYD